MRRRSALSVTVTALTAALVGVLAPASPAAAAVTNGQIAYVRSDTGAGNPDIWLMNPDGSNKRVVLRNARAFRWSPDGLRVAYIQFSTVTGVDTLFVAAANLTGRRSLGAWTEVDWSPDGTMLAATRLVGSNRELFLKPVNGAAATRITRTGAQGCAAGAPDWGPGGLLYVLDCSAATTPRVELHSVAITNGAVVKDGVLVSAPVPATSNAVRIEEARFRANGRILFTGCVPPNACPANARNSLYEVNAGTVSRIAAIAPADTGLGFVGLAPAPVGSQVAVGLSTATTSGVRLRPSQQVLDPLGDGAEDWQPLLAP